MVAQPVYQGFMPAPSVPGASEVICLLNERGVIRFATPATADFYGYSLDELIGRSGLRFVAPEDADSVNARWQSWRADPARQSDEMRVMVQLATGQRLAIRMTIWRQPDSSDFLLVHHIFDDLQDRLRTLYSIQAAVASTLEPETVLDTVLREVHRLIACGTSTIFIRGRDGSVLVRRWQQGKLENFRSIIHERLPEFQTSRIMRDTNRPLIIHDTATDPRWVNLPDHRPIRSWLGAPLIHRGEFLGELNLDNVDPNVFSQEDAELVQALAIQVAAALHNARQFADEQRRAEKFRALSEVSQAISQLDLDNVLELVYRNINALMDARTFFIGLHDKESGLIRLRGAYEQGQRVPDDVLNAETGLSGMVIRTSRPVIIHDSEAEGFPSETIIDGTIPRSMLMIPLITKDEVIGVITVQSSEPNTYTAEDVEVLEIIAGNIATAVSNAQLYDQVVGQMHVLAALHEMSLDLAALQDPDEAAARVTRTVLELFRPDEVRLCLCYDAQWEPKTWIATDDRDPVEVVMRLGLAKHLPVEQVRQTNQPLVLAHPNDYPGLETVFDTPWPVRSALVFPVIRGDQRLATLSLLYSQPQFFARDRLRNLELLCSQVATALQNARSTVALRRRLDEVSALHDLAREVSGMETLDEIVQRVVDRMREVYQCKSASIALVDPTGMQVVTLAASGMDPRYIEQARFAVGEYVAGEVVTTGRVIYVPDTAADPNFRIVDPNIRSLMVVPLTVHGRVIGTMGIDGAVPHAFTPDHEQVLTIAGGQIAAAIETVRLLQQARAHSHQLAQANEQLSAQDELRRELIYQVSHDLRGPLQIVYGYADMMRDEMLGPVTQTQKEILSMMLKRSRAIEALTKDIMAARPISSDTLDLARVNLTEVSQHALTDAQMVCKDPRFRFEAQLAPVDLWVEADYNRLSRVFDNLIGNAIKFSPNGGLILLRTEHRVESQCVRIYVTDQGIGIPSQKLPYIFERFYRGDKAFRQRFEGTGLGLFIVQQIVEAHRGKVWVESDEGAGSTFCIELPLLDHSQGS
ncbi:MAG: GAF domain-containing protein [Chloroflexi bacterium]|nr:GAF domain-containing protein [Chloroflexota bacterium]